jgi:hypothetical protein
MYAAHARQLGFRTKLASRARAARSLFGFLPQAKNPIIQEVQGATEQSLAGAFLGETITDLLQKEDLRGEAAIVGATTGLGQYLGSRFLPRRLFPAVANKALAGLRPDQLSAANRVLRAGAGFTPSQISAGRGIGTLAGLAAGLLALQGLKYLVKNRKAEDQK